MRLRSRDRWTHLRTTRRMPREKPGPTLSRPITRRRNTCPDCAKMRPSIFLLIQRSAPRQKRESRRQRFRCKMTKKVPPETRRSRPEKVRTRVAHGYLHSVNFCADNNDRPARPAEETYIYIYKYPQN